MNILPKILVTGGAGYIGSHAIVELLKSGFTVVSVDNYSNSSAATYGRIKRVTGQEVLHYNIDICDREKISSLFKQHPDIGGIIHFAALKSVPESVANPLFYYHNNLNSLINLLHCSAENNIRYFIFSSSCSVYGNLAQLPVTENTSFQKAESPYGYTKQIGEQIIRDFSTVNPLIKTVLLRYFNPVGAHSSGELGEIPSGRPNNLVPVITQTAVGKIKEMQVFGNDYKTRDGTCVRDYVHVSDIAQAHVDALRYVIQTENAPITSVFNLGTGNGVTVLEMIEAFEKASGKKLNYKIAPRRAGDVEAIYSDCSHVLKTLNWKPRYTIDDMMQTAWQWQLNLERQS